MKNKRIKFSKLSKKIIFSLFVIIILLSSVSYIVVHILINLGLFDFNNLDNTRPLSFIFPIIFGSIIMVLFSLVLHKSIIVRIQKLRSATELVAKGNFDNTLELKGNDELSDLANSFNKMTKELQANVYLSKEFVRNISHEYKTPLAIIKSYSELIQNEIDKNTEINKESIIDYSNIIINEIDRMSALSRTIINLSLLDSTTIVKKEDNFSPAEQIRNILRNTNLIWSEKNIEFILNLNNQTINGNEQMTYQIWENLINNAIKFSNNNDKVKIDLSVYNGDLTFIIEDNGIGINKEDINKLFNHFYVGDKSRNSTGSGLGLAIVKTIVEKLEGTISYESKENIGTKFIIKI